MASGPTWNPKRGTWNVQYWEGHWRRVVVVKKQPRWKPGNPPPKIPPEAHAALARYAAIEKEAKELRGKSLPDSLEAFLRDHVASYHNDLSRESAGVVAEQFVAWCHARKLTKFRDVTADVCGEWLDEQAKRWKISTTKRKRAMLRVAWSKVSKRKRIPNPWDGVEAAGRVVHRKRGSWTKEEFHQILAVSRPWLRDLLTLGVYTGLRINALMHLEWGHIKLSPAGSDSVGVVKVPQHLDKGGKGYDVPIAEELNELLVRRRMLGDGDFVLVGQGGNPIRSRGGTGQAIQRACRRAGLVEPDSPNHQMRRTFGRWAHFGTLTGQKIPLYIVSRWLGHSSTKTTEIYLDVREEDSSRWISKVPQDE